MNLLKGRFLYKCVLVRERGTREGMSRSMFPNLRRTHEYRNLSP